MSVALTIRSRRKTKGWTQKEAAEKLGVHNITWTRWETGVASPHEDVRPELAKLLGGKAEDYVSAVDVESPATVKMIASLQKSVTRLQRQLDEISAQLFTPDDPRS